MAYWHYEDGSPAPWGKGTFDPSHAAPMVIVLLACIAYLLWG